MGGRGGLPMAQRVRVGRYDDDCPGRHCWVSGSADEAGVKRPGLLVEWRVADLGWEGRVVYLARLRGDTWALVEEWLPASLLTPR